MSEQILSKKKGNGTNLLRALGRVLAMPWYVLSVFTSAKSFRDNPIIGSQLLNRLGLHVWRVRMAHFIFAFRQKCLSSFVTSEEAAEYEENGFLVIENFLSETDFEKLQAEVEGYEGEAFETVQGDTLTWRVMLGRILLKTMPACRALTDNSRFRRLLAYCGGKNQMPLVYIQQIRNGFQSAAKDPQKNLHTDTFHPTMKAWLFLQDVDIEDGPFTYVPGSNQLTQKRLNWEKEKSISAAVSSDYYSARGSFRISVDELPVLGLPEARSLSVRKNTLVIANTFGFHRRGDIQKERCTRLEIWAMSRVNPFNPWPGLGLRIYTDVRDRIFLAYKRRKHPRHEKSKVIVEK